MTLVARIADGDDRALDELHRRHASWLLARLRRRTTDAGIAEEALQDAFVKVWRKADTYRGDGDVGAWLWRIAVRCLLDLVRRRLPTPVGSTPADQPCVDTPEERVVVAVERDEVLGAVELLRPGYRAVLEATVVDELTTREAARRLDLPTGTVKSHAMRAREELRAALV